VFSCWFRFCVDWQHLEMHPSWLHAILALSPWIVTAAAGSEALPDWHPVETTFGSMQVREFGPHDGPLVICIHGMMDNDFIRNEWNAVAGGLAKEGFHVVLPDFHSAPAVVRPGACSGDDVRKLVVDLALELDGFVPARYRSVAPPRIAVMGKSWGAKMAAEAGALQQVVAVGLVTPAVSEKEAPLLFSQIRTSDVALAMTHDDDVAKFERADLYKEILRRKKTYKSHAKLAPPSISFIQWPRGGHRIVPEFTEPLAKFCTRARDAGRWMHEGDVDEKPEL